MQTGEKSYKKIAENIRLKRISIGITQEQLAEKAEVSVDTVKSVENVRRTMCLDTYLKIAGALGIEPFVLLAGGEFETYLERFHFIMVQRSKKEIEFALHILEQILNGQDIYFSK